MDPGERMRTGNREADLRHAGLLLLFNCRWRVPPAPAASGCHFFLAHLAGVKDNRIKHERYSRVW